MAMRPATGWLWVCPACDFRAERVAGTLVELTDGASLVGGDAHRYSER
jgi:hypothetical protein